MSRSVPSLPDYSSVLFSHVIDNARQIEAVNASSGLPVNFRAVRGGAASVRIGGGRGTSLSVWDTRSSTGFLMLPNSHRDVVTIQFIVTGALRTRVGNREQVGRHGRATVVAFEEMRNEETSRDFESFGVTMYRTALASAHVALHGEAAGPVAPFVPVVDVAGVPLQILKRTVEHARALLTTGLSEADLVLPLLEEVVMYQVLTAWPRKTGQGHGASAVHAARPLNRALEFIDVHIARKLLLSDVARAAGVSVRRLQTLFLKEIGSSPVQYILGLRLDRARAEIETCEHGATIGAVALRWGFTHMGDFSRRYRERFGELPSVEKKRRG